MNKKETYRSFSFNPFNIWRIFLVCFIIPGLLYSLLMQKPYSIIYFGLLTAIIISIFLIRSYAVLRYDGETLEIKSMGKQFQISSIQKVSTWWSYDMFTKDSRDEEDKVAENKQMSAYINKINCYIKFTSGQDSIYVYEQIHMGDKFPNNHRYIESVRIENDRLIKIWDIDKCLAKLKIDANE